MTDIKDKVVGVSLSTIISIGSVAALAWAFMKPAIISAIKTEIKTEVKSEIMIEIAVEMGSKLGPLQAAFKEILQSNINVSKRAIAQLEHDKEFRPDTWTSERARILADRYIELQSQERAYEAL